jgi:pimeloyl-ACP methyl ester carboxylesterase
MGNPELRRKEKAMHATSIVKNIVLVHGASADGTSWSKIIPILEAEGYNVVAVQNPLTSLADDVAATKRIIALQDGPVILVGHSWGGAVITRASDDHNGCRVPLETTDKLDFKDKLDSNTSPLG